MDIDKLAEEVWLKERDILIDPDNIDKHIFILGFKKGFEHGNSRPQSFINNISVFETGLKENNSLQELACMQCRITSEVYFQLMGEFVKNQSVLNKVYKDQFEVNNHFLNWIRQNAKKIQQQKNNAGRL